MNHIDAMRLVASHSFVAMPQATKALQALQGGSPIAWRRVIGAIKSALADPAATFTVADRQALGAVLAGIEEPDTRDTDLRIRVTFTEKARVERDAATADMTVSAYVRAKLGLE
ncbi:MAG: hypothetical protein KGH75_00645 [Rhodospirillales bacterium]|nr:hypothetical protein [Rhodospirillales bacterium]